MKRALPVPRHYLVGVFDVLGLSTAFQTFSGIPKDPEPLALAFEETTAVLKWFQTAFPSLFDPYPFDKDRLAPYERDLHRIETLLGESTVKLQMFGDLVVPYVILHEPEYHLRALSAIFRMLNTAGSLFVLSLANGRAIRGGIDAESAIERAPGEIYGRALNEALGLEMRKAEYPRIAIGNSLRAYLKTIAQNTEKNVFADHAKALAERCSRLIMDDIDGQPMLHYLSKEFKPLGLEVSAFTQARAVIAHQRAHWDSIGHDSLIQRYDRLLYYWQEYGAHRR